MRFDGEVSEFITRFLLYLSEETTVERELSPVEAIPDNYPKFVMTMDEFNRSRIGTQYLNIIKFLLEE